VTEARELDVLIIGAGISGIGAAYHLQRRCPDRSYAILEGRSDLGGTWDLFRYPGIRSDSDMHTLGFSFKPWIADKSIADGPSILAYLRETATENGIDRHIRFGHMVTNAEWSSNTATWTVTVTLAESGEVVALTCNFLMMASGYYSYKSGYTPDFAGRDRFAGEIVHPQKWPAALDYAGKRVVVIGSGATAMTLVPSLAREAAHVTMLQRSPTYVVSSPDVDVINVKLRKYLPKRLAYRLTRKKNIWLSQFFYNKARSNPDGIKKRLLNEVRKALGPDFDVDKHFTPSYNPWDQRICLVPNGDLFEAIKTGSASVVTDHIDTITETGVLLESGEHLDADIIITATGLQLVTLGETDFMVDGEAVDFSQTWTYKGLAYSDVPNLVSFFGYINASWTLRVDITADVVCRLLDHMDSTRTSQCTPRLRHCDLDMKPRPMVDNFSSGYMQRMLPQLPRQGDRAPWINPQLYAVDQKMLGKQPVDDGVMQFTRPIVGTTTG